MTRLSGRVPETGTAISGATVAIIDTQGTDDTTQWSIVASDTTDANGEWSVSGLEPSAVERYHAVAQFDSGVEFVNFESLPFLSTPADAFAPTTPVNVGTPTAEVGIPAFFDVTITNTNTPVDEGDILTVDFSANNTGTFQDTQDIRLEIDNVEEDRDNNVTLDGGVSTTGTLQWDTTNETPAQYTATVLSNDDADSVTVQVESAIPDSAINRYIVSSGSGTTVTDSVGSADLSLSGATKVSDSQAQDDYKLDFDGNDDEATATIDISNLSEFLLCFTVETSVTEDSRYFGFDEDSINGLIEVGQNNDDLLFWNVGNGNNLINIKSSSTITDGQKYRAQVGIVENDKLSVAINATEETTTSFGTKGDPSNSFVGGRQPTDTTRYADIFADDIILYDTVSSQVRQDDYNLQPWS